MNLTFCTWTAGSAKAHGPASVSAPSEAVSLSGAVEGGGVKKTKRGKRGGKKHAMEAELKSVERQRKLPGRHSLDAMLSTAAESGCRLSSLRHMVISEQLPTPKVPPPPFSALLFTACVQLLPEQLASSEFQQVPAHAKRPLSALGNPKSSDNGCCRYVQQPPWQ